MDNVMLTSSSSSEMDSSDDEDGIIRGIRRPRPWLRPNLFENYNEKEFKIRFRFSKEACIAILEMIQENLTFLSLRNEPICPMLQLLITLRFYATGSFQLCVGDCCNVSKSSVCRIIHKVTNIIAQLRPHFIRLPQHRNEVLKIHNDFYEIAGFPNVLGAIDCTHIKVQSPGGDYGEVYTQAVCDAHLKFMDVVARWPGSVHDSTIFNDSRLRLKLEADELPNTYLLGDSGYACKRYLLTPLLNPQDRAEQRYNHSHKTTRNTVERSFGVLKRRFPCLAIGMRLSIDRVLAVIVATMVLHNIAIEMREEDPEIQVPQVEQPADIFDPRMGNQNMAVRTALINTVFNR